MDVVIATGLRACLAWAFPGLRAALLYGTFLVLQSIPSQTQALTDWSLDDCVRGAGGPGIIDTYTVSPTITPSFTASPTDTPYPPGSTLTFTRTATPSPSPTKSPTTTPSASPTASPTQTPSLTPSHSPTPRPTTTAALTAFMDSPSEDAVLTGPTVVTGTAQAGDLEYWTLSYRPIDTDSWTQINRGTDVVDHGALGALDTTLLLDGFYELNLHVQQRDGYYVEDVMTVEVAGQRKIGNLSLSFTDAQVPLQGLSFNVTRSYDSRDKAVGDFGVGWRMALGMGKVRFNMARGMGDDWQTSVSGGCSILNFSRQYCISPVAAHRAVLTLPGGKPMRFDAQLGGACRSSQPVFDSSLYFYFTDEPGTTGALEILSPNPAQLSLDGEFDCAQAPLDATIDDVATQDSYQPNLFRYTAQDGSYFVFDSAGNVKELGDLNNNKISITPGGLVHSNGAKLAISRDGQNRVSSLTDLQGNHVTYSYSAAGDLSTVTDRDGNTTKYKYDTQHRLVDILDGRDVRALHNVYDASGRLIGSVDADNQSIDYTHDLAHQTEKVVDRLNHVTEYGYDDNGNVTYTKDAEGGITRATYDADGNKLSEVDARGFVTKHTYDSGDHLLSTTDPLGNVTRYQYNSRGQVVASYDANGHGSFSVYDAKGNLTRSTDAKGNNTDFVYDANGNLKEQTDAQGNKTTYTFDGNGRLIGQIQPDLSAVTWEYDANGNRTSEKRMVNGVPQVTTFSYDNSGHLLTTTRADGSVVGTLYNEIGKPDTTTDALGRLTRYAYDNNGRLERTDYPDSTYEKTEYDEEGHRTSFRDRGGQVVTYDYDNTGRLTLTHYNDGTYTETVYGPSGLVQTEYDANRNATTYGYDPSGRRTRVTDALGHSTTYGYDASGNQTSVTDANGHTTRYSYDEMNRPVGTSLPDGNSLVTTYDSLGRRVAEQDAHGSVKGYTYDSVGRLTRVYPVNSDQSTYWEYTYDQAGNQLTQRDALGRVTKYEYNTLNQRTKRILPLGQWEHYDYDAQGRLADKRTFNGDTINYGYDNADRLISKKGPGLDVSFGYDGAGRRTSMTYPLDGSTAHVSYVYDSRGRLDHKVTPQGTLRYTYDASGNLQTVHSDTPGGVTNEYHYDELNLMDTMTDLRTGGGVTNYHYDALGNLKLLTYSNGVSTSYTYDPLNRVTDINSVHGATLLRDYFYTLRDDGFRTQLVESGPNTNRISSWEYDAGNRLAKETISGANAAIGVIEYTYDKVGNRLKRTSTVTGLPSQPSLTYDDNDRSNGNGWDDNGATLADAKGTYQYDSEGHLIHAAMSGQTVDIVYDGDGNRVRKSVNSGSVTTVIDYLVDTNNLSGYSQVVEEKHNNSVVIVYIFGYRLVAQAKLSSASSEYNYFGYDAADCTRYLTNADGNVSVSVNYDAFGTIVDEAAAQDTTSYLFSGEQYDRNLGMYSLRARYLNPDLGRFGTLDPVQFKPGTRFNSVGYGYCENRPTMEIDPSGNDGIYDILVEGFENLGEFIFGSPAKAANSTPELDFTNLQNRTARLKTLVTYFNSAAKQESIDPFVLMSLGWSESKWLSSVGTNTNKSTDHGIMQINSVHKTDAIDFPDQQNILNGAKIFKSARGTAKRLLSGKVFSNVRFLKKSFDLSVVDIDDSGVETPSSLLTSDEFDMNYVAVWVYKNYDIGHADSWRGIYGRWGTFGSATDGVPPQLINILTRH